ncbi:hypothetical protein RFI_11500 [Reticulomyxa filosa]|uniref:Uncharacterized protein n=1 Tax=Reticulomyxa filosa TaxID=46433 RepID=X6NHZ9_RETFI|nr:hypothetical protein RFI_11500 [Reticulomyxa filosa]|eukprot:ETO25636.1 hypothetical protein RFI_11500 [Reticulomyxa filosa]
MSQDKADVNGAMHTANNDAGAVAKKIDEEKNKRKDSLATLNNNAADNHTTNLSTGSLFSEPPAFFNATEEKVSELMEQLEDLQEEFQDLKNSHSALEAERDELKSQLDQANDRGHAFESKWNELNKIVQESVRMKEEMEKKMKAMELENEEISRQLNEYETLNFQLKNETQQKGYEIESLLKEIKLVKRKTRHKHASNHDSNDDSNANESSDEVIEDIKLTNEPEKDAGQKNDAKQHDKKIRYITEVQVKALQDEWTNKLNKKDNEIKSLKKKCAKYVQQNEMNRSLREDWKVQLEEMKKGFYRHTKEIYERDLEIVRLKQLVAMFTRQNLKNYHKVHQNNPHQGNAHDNASVVRAPLIIRGGQRKREENVLRQMNIDPTQVETAQINEEFARYENNDNNKVSEESQVSDSKTDLE